MKDQDSMIVAYREMYILSKLSAMKNNVFTTKLEKIVIAGNPKTFQSVFLIMELMPTDLKSLMSDPYLKFDDEHAVIILYNILCGMAFLDAAGILHRDLKPANILINDQS
jgi:serine/threonine protein kinase